MYEAFNERDIEAAIAGMKDDVVWANGMEGGHVHGTDAVREYWTRQFEIVLATLRIEGIGIEGETVTVQLHTHAVDLASGETVADEDLEHIFRFEDGLVARFDIAGAEEE